MLWTRGVNAEGGEEVCVVYVNLSVNRTGWRGRSEPQGNESGRK